MKMGNRFLLTLHKIASMNSIHTLSKFLLAVLLIFLSVTASLRPQSVDSLVGNWELIKNAAQWDVNIKFKENQDFFVQRHLSAKYSYQLNGDTLISFLQRTYPDSETIIDTSFITVRNDTIIRTYEKSGQKNSIHMIRDTSYDYPGDSMENPLIGRWKWTYPSRDTAVETFLNDHTWDFSVTGRIYDGHFEVNKDTLTMIYNDKKKTKRVHTFWLQENMLGIKDLETNKEYLYRRIKK